MNFKREQIPRAKEAIPTVSLEARNRKIAAAQPAFDRELFQREWEDQGWSEKEVHRMALVSLSPRALRAAYNLISEDNPSDADQSVLEAELPDGLSRESLLEMAQNVKLEGSFGSSDIFAFQVPKLVEKKDLPRELQKRADKNELLKSMERFSQADLKEHAYVADIALEIYPDNERRLRYTQFFLDKIETIRGKFPAKARDREAREAAITEFVEEQKEGLFLRAQEQWDPLFCNNIESLSRKLKGLVNSPEGNQEAKKFYRDLFQHYKTEGEELRSLREQLSSWVRPDENFKGLKRHQLLGINFLLKKERAILADEMGLGKTLTGIFAALGAQTKRNVVIGPNSLISNWREELKRTNVPEENILVVRGKEELVALEGGPAGADSSFPVFILFNNEKLSGDYAERITQQINDNSQDTTLIVDEAHNFKSSWANSNRTEAIAGLKSKKLFLLSGTPIVNGGEDLYNYLSLISSEEYPQEAISKKGFKQKINTPEGAEEVYKILKGCMLRRRIADYDQRIREIKEAAEKQEITVDLKGKIREVYLRVIKSFQEKAKTSDVLSQKDYIRALHLLKKLETDPFLVSDQAKENTIFSYLTSQELEEVFETTDPEQVATILSRELLPEKIQKTIEMIRNLPSDQNAVVYVCNPETTKRMAELLNEQGVVSTFISGEVKDDTRRQSRSERIADFNDPTSVTRVLVMNQVGGEGLNLQSASHLFKLDSPWTAAQDAQIDARIIRLGQKLAVKIYSFITKNLSELTSSDGSGQPIRTIDSYARRVVLPAKERLAEFFLEGLLTKAELEELEAMRDAEKRIMLRLAGVTIAD